MFGLGDHSLLEHEIKCELTSAFSDIVCDDGIRLCSNYLRIDRILRFARKLEKGVGVRRLRQGCKGSALNKIKALNIF